MSGQLESRWDDAVETAWREFRQRVADRLDAMSDGEALLVELTDVAEEGAAPYCLAINRAGWLRLEAVSNHHLAAALLLDPAQCETLAELGFAAPLEDEPDDPGEGSTNHWADIEQREADRAAVMTVRALREVHGVVHPIYLKADGLEPDGAVLPLPPVPALDGPLRPRSPDEVRAGIDAALQGMLDTDPEWDDDGDLPVPTPRGAVVGVGLLAEGQDPASCAPGRGRGLGDPGTSGGQPAQPA